MVEEQKLSLTRKVLSLSKVNVSSFHALPVSKKREGGIPKVLLDLVGERFLQSEITYDWIDNLVFPKKALKQSECDAAKIFGVDRTMYITSGTTVANQIALLSLLKRKDRVLVDRTCHQSIHFILDLLGVEIKYIPLKKCNQEYNRRFTDYGKGIELFKEAMHNNNPFKTVIINASSYEGVCCNTLKFVDSCLKYSLDTVFIIDEAWLGFAKFHKETENLTILSSIKKIKNINNAKIVITQSAHKSLNSLRQGSYIHVVGGNDFINFLEEGKYKYHTTSPSIPILSSLEIACVDMLDNGERYISNSLKLANILRNKVNSLSNFSIINNTDKDYLYDPLKVSILFDRFKVDIFELKKKMRKSNVYISRFGENFFLVNMHIGTKFSDIEKLISVLKNIDDEIQLNSKDVVSEEYIIPYPPGVPIITPGEKVDEEMLKRLLYYTQANVRLVHIKGKGR